MIASNVVAEIRALLHQGELSQRKIAERVGVSRGTVHAIAKGKRPEKPRRRPARFVDYIPPSGPAMRCHTCGGKVQMPCLRCYLESLSSRKTG